MAGLPIETPGTVLQRNCASGLGALVHAAHAITAGEGDVYLVGGVESMSRSPLVLSRSESPFARDVKLYDSTIGPRFSNPKLVKRFGDSNAEVAKHFNISREAVRLWVKNGIPPDRALEVEEVTRGTEFAITATEVLQYARHQKEAA